MLENEGATIPNHLKIMEKQPLMKMVDFHSLVIKWTRSPPHIMKRHLPSLTPYPVCAWEKILCTLLNVDETTLGTGEPVSHWIRDLENEFGRIDLEGYIASSMVQHRIICLFLILRRLSQLHCSKRLLFMHWQALQLSKSRSGLSPLAQASPLWLRR